MKATLEFDLSTDRYEYEAARHGPQLLVSLNQIRQAIRSALKYEEHSDETRAQLEKLRELIPFELLSTIEEG